MREATAYLNIEGEGVCYVHRVRDPKTVDLQPV